MSNKIAEESITSETNIEGEEKVYKVFISYSWTSPEHEQWVIDLSERLMSNGIDVIIDKWNLKEGQDKYDFMETMVKSPDIDKVLIILDKKYVEKANGRKGGVGTETQIISPEIYDDVAQEKFIPLITEVDDKGKAYTPVFLSSRKYINFSDETKFEEAYDKLIRNIYQRPAHVKPKRGTPPSYLFEDQPSTYKTTFIVKSLDNHLEKSPTRINTIIQEFSTEFLLILKEFNVKFKDNSYYEVGKAICESINAFTALRNDFISFYEKIFKSGLPFDIDLIIKMIEELPMYLAPQDGRSSWSPHEFDHIRFISRELFLYLITIGLKNEKYKVVSDLLHSKYFYRNPHSDNKPKPFTELAHYVKVIDTYYNQTYSNTFISPMSDLIIKRIPAGYTKEEILTADYLCYYISELFYFNPDWFPITYFYKSEYGSLEFFDRMISKRHFEKIKILFDVTTVAEFTTLISAYIEKNKGKNLRTGFSQSWERLRTVEEVLHKDNIATEK